MLGVCLSPQVSELGNWGLIQPYQGKGELWLHQQAWWLQWFGPKVSVAYRKKTVTKPKIQSA